MNPFENPTRTNSTKTPVSVPAKDGSISAFRPSTDTSALRALQTIVEPGTLIDRFQVGKLLGRGSLAAVYEGTDTENDEPVALKILDARFSSDSNAVARFLAEGEALAKFNHPNIVHHIAHGSDSTFAYIAMELVRGITLDQLIYAIEIEPRHIVHLAREISKALTALHAAGMIHGDVKPSNILVTRPGEVKISDFGTAAIAKVSRVGNTRVSGTAAYMAPELFDSATPVDYRADIYSLGVTFYKVLTGKLPSDPPVPATALNPDLPAAVDTVLAKALARDPEKRHITIKEFADHLAALFDETAPVTPVSGPSDVAGDSDSGTGSNTPQNEKEAGSRLDWKMIILCVLAAVGLAATLIVLAVYFGRW